MQKQFFSLASTVLLSCSLAMLTACNSSSPAESASSNTKLTDNSTIPEVGERVVDTGGEPVEFVVERWPSTPEVGERVVDTGGEPVEFVVERWPINTEITSYPVCTHQLGEPEPYPVIDNNTGKPLDLQPYVASYPCIEPGAMTICSHQPGEPDPHTQYDTSTNKALNPQPYLKFYYCFANDIRKVTQ